MYLKNITKEDFKIVEFGAFKGVTKCIFEGENLIRVELKDSRIVKVEDFECWAACETKEEWEGLNSEWRTAVHSIVKEKNGEKEGIRYCEDYRRFVDRIYHIDQNDELYLVGKWGENRRNNCGYEPPSRQG